MSSGQWEVVGKNKKNGQNGKSKKDDKKNGSKPEDLVNRVEVDVDKKGGKEKKKDVDQKKPKKQEKKTEASKSKPPKTLEAAFQAIDPNELATLIATNKIRFLNAPLVWLKEIATFLNSKTQIEVDDPTFQNYPPTYPLNVLPTEIKNNLVTVLQDAGKPNTQLFFDVTLTTVANDMSRGQTVNGHRLLLQLLAHEYPEFCVASILKSTNLRNSYQNRPPIGLTLLWAFGQGGYKDFGVGLKAWQELFLPILELKNYSKYIVLYLSKLLDRHLNMDNTSVTLEQLLSLLDTINAKRTGLPKDLSSDLIKQLAKIKDIFFKNSGNKLQVTFNQLMKKMPNQFVESNNLDNYHRILVECLVDCLERDDSCNASWRQLFIRCTKPSATLISYIHKNWDDVSKRLKLKSLKLTVIQYQEVCGDALKGKKKDETVAKANQICQDIISKMATKTRRFPWILASFFLLISIGGLIAFDVSRAGGNFPKSTTGRLLNDLGILEQTQHVWQKSLSTSARGYIWLESNAPIYYNHAANVSKPYLELVRDLAVISANNAVNLYGNVKEYVDEKAPIVQAKVDEYAPGLIDNVVSYSAEGWKAARKIGGDCFTYTSQLLKEKVFVGQLSPENIQDKTQLAFNTTRTHVTEYLNWLRQQVQLYSKIP